MTNALVLAGDNVVKPFEVSTRWWTILIVLAVVASVNLCLYFFCYAPALAPIVEAAPRGSQ